MKLEFFENSSNLKFWKICQIIFFFNSSNLIFFFNLKYWNYLKISELIFENLPRHIFCSRLTKTSTQSTYTTFPTMLIIALLCFTPTYSWKIPPKIPIVAKAGITNFTDSIPTHTTNYHEFVKTAKLFVDTTELICKMLHPKFDDSGTIVWLGPKNVGKSLNLNMMRAFFEMPLDQQGKEIQPRIVTKAFKLFAVGDVISDDGDIQKLQTPLQISNQKHLMGTHLGQYPLIHLSFENVTGDTYEEIAYKMRIAIAEAFKQHSYLLTLYEKYNIEIPKSRRNFTNNRLEPKFATSLEKNNHIFTSLNKYINHEDFNRPDDQFRLKFLRNLLFQHFHKQVVILLDDYDAPVMHLLRNTNSSYDEVQKVIFLLQMTILNTFVHTGSLYRGIITGTYNFIHDENFHYFYIAHKNHQQIPEFFGFSFLHVQELFHKHHIDGTLSHEAHKWYKKYYSTYSEQAFYNPASIVHFLKERQIASYGEQSGNKIYIKNVIRFQHQIRKTLLALISGGQTETRIGYLELLRMDADEISKLSSLLANNTYESTFYSYLVTEGYLIATNTDRGKIPNKEIAFVISNWLISYCKEAGPIQEELLQNAALTLRDYVRSDHSNDTLFISAWQDLYNSISVNSFNFADESVIVHTIFVCVSLRMQVLTKFQINARYVTQPRTFVLMTDDETLSAIAIKLNYRSPSANNAMIFLKKKTSAFKDFLGIPHIKLIGIDIAFNKRVTCEKILCPNPFYRRSDILETTSVYEVSRKESLEDHFEAFRELS